MKYVMSNQMKSLKPLVLSIALWRWHTQFGFSALHCRNGEYIESNTFSLYIIISLLRCSGFLWRYMYRPSPTIRVSLILDYA